MLHRDVEATVASLGAAGAGWREAMDRLLPVADPLAHAILAPLPPVRPVVPLLGGLGRDLVVWARRLLSSVEALGLELFDGDRRATAWLAASAQHSGLPPTTTVSGAFGMLLQVVGHRHGWPLPRGGMGRLVDVLVALAGEAGARVRCDAPVEQILVRGDRVRGARLRGGEELGADAVITTITARPLVRMLPPGTLPGRLEQRLHAWRYSTGPFKIDYALSGAVPWTAAEARTTAVVHVAGELEELTGAAQAGQRGEVPQRPALVVGQQSLHDADAGTRRLPHPLRLRARPVALRARRRGGRRPDRGAARSASPPASATWCSRAALRPPRAAEADNPSLVGGDLGGGSYELDQQLVVPPAPGAGPLPRAAARPVRRGRLHASRRRRARGQRPRRRPGAAQRPAAAPVARASARRLEPPQRLGGCAACAASSASGLHEQARLIGPCGVSIIVT